MPLHVLTDSQVREICLDLSHDDLVAMYAALAESLHEYSTGDTNSPCCASYQPDRVAIRKKQATTIFMPASTGTNVGMKVLTVEKSADDSKPRKMGTLSHQSTSSSVASGIDALRLTPTATDDSQSERSSISGSSFQAPPIATTTPKGSVTIMDALGGPRGILNVDELTAFRTALSATAMLQKRRDVDTITVFGAGKQAFWHIRLALMLRAKDIHHVNIINPTFDGAVHIMKSFQPSMGGKKEWSHVKFSVLTPEFGEYGRLLKEEVRKADVIFCCTPSTEPLFPHEFLTSHEGRRKGRYIAAVGSYTPQMIELHPEILRSAVKKDTGGHHHHHKHARQEGVIIVDTLDGALREAGEIIQAKLTPDQLVEAGELIMVKRSVLKEKEAGGEGEKGLFEWLHRGQVIYKQVGLGLMDLVVGSELIRLGIERDIGTNIPDF